jgi:hypothetical protein
VEARKNLLEEADEALKLTVTPAPERLVIPRRYVDNAGHTKAREKIGAVPVETSQRTLKGAKANVTFDLPGTYRIQLTAIDDAGAAATREFSLVVEP